MEKSKNIRKMEIQTKNPIENFGRRARRNLKYNQVVLLIVPFYRRILDVV